MLSYYDQVFQSEMQLFSEDNTFQIENWMEPHPEVIHPSQSFKEAAHILEKLDKDCLPVVSEEMTPLGVVTSSSVLNGFLHEKQHEPLINSISKENFSIVSANASLLELLPPESSVCLVVNNENKLTGILTKEQIIQGFSFYIQEYDHPNHTSDIINTILESAYEGVAVVNGNGTVVAFNDAYSRFIGVDKAEVIGENVQDVIDNTNLHNTVKTGMPERGAIQYIHGQAMVVHRIPIWKNGHLVGAIGMLIFEGLSELYKIYERMQQNNQASVPQRPAAWNNQSEESPATLEQIIGASASTAESKATARKIAEKNVTTLITGESGTGKEMYAKGIHHLSSFSTGSFVSVNCGAIPSNLFEAELFGYDEGAFTDARKGGKPGKLELAQNGTLFLDEIGEMPLDMQTKLLRVLQEKEFERIGGTKRFKLNIRVITATNTNLFDLLEKGGFRKDLYYRINVIEIPVAPLRERKEDIPPLVSHYLDQICTKHQVPVKSITPEAMTTLVHHPWHGNIRELTNIIEKLVVLVDHEIIAKRHLPGYLSETTSGEREHQSVISTLKKGEEQKEKEWIVTALEKNDGNKSKTAEELGIHRTTLYQKLKKYSLS